MKKEKLRLFDIIFLAIEVETENIKTLVKKANDNDFIKIIDEKKLKSEIHKYCNKIISCIDSIRGLE